MAALLMAFMLSAAEPAEELKIATPGLVVTGLDASLAAPLTDQLARPFAPVRVVTPRDIAALLGLERQKELLGCSDGGCLAELGNALGVQGVLLGDVLHLGSTIQVNTRIIEPVGGRQLAAASTTVEAEEQLLEALTRVGLDLKRQFYGARGLVPPPELVPQPAPEKGGGTRRFFPIPAVLAGLSALGGGVLLGLSEGSYQQLTGGMRNSLTGERAVAVANEGKAFQLAGTLLLGLAGVSLVVALGLLFFGSRE
jgi:hypothetical protein